MGKEKLETKLVPGVGRVPIPAYKGSEPYIFVSYAHMDHELVFPEIKRFNDAGFNVWYDEGIEPGNEWPKDIAKALSKCSLFVLMVTPNSVVRRNVRNEINFALKKNKPFIAIHLQETELPEDLELLIGAVQAINKYNMSDEAYEYQYIEAFKRYGLKQNQRHDVPDGGNNNNPGRPWQKTVALWAAIGLISAGIIAGIIAISSGCSQTSSKADPTEALSETISGAKDEETAASEAEQSTEDLKKIIDEANSAAFGALTEQYEQLLGNGTHGVMASYISDDPVLKDAAYTADNAAEALMFISQKNDSDSFKIVNGFIFGADYDRYKPGRIRNAYAAGDLEYKDEEGKLSAKLPGWWDSAANQWCEDTNQVGCNVGSTSLAVLAMLKYDALVGQDASLETSKALMDWVIDECSDSKDGFTAGFDGWPEADKATVLTYKSTSDNIKAYAAFKQLYAVTGDEKYKKAADSALAFVKSMYVKDEAYFCTGTKNDGVTPNYSVLTLDTQVLAALALGDEFKDYEAVMNTIARMKTSEGAYPYCQENKNGGFWCEGTAMTALMYKLRGDDKSYNEAMAALAKVQLDDGMLPSASIPNLSTGIWTDENTEWEYTDCAQIAPTAWFTLAYNGSNPFSFENNE